MRHPHKNRRDSLAVLGVWCLCLALLGGCGKGPKSPENRKDNLHALIVASVEDRMLQDSKAEMSRQLSASELREAKAYVERNRDYASYHLLFAIRKQSPELYGRIPASTRAAILCSALARTALVNDWAPLGASEEHRGVAANALVETSEECLPCLKPLLADARTALVEGSIATTRAVLEEHRRCDYAYWFICLVLGKKYSFAKDVAERNKNIRQLMSELEVPAFRTLDVLIAASKEGKRLVETDVLRERRWCEAELALAKSFVESHPYHVSYLVLLEIRRQSHGV